MYYKYLYFTLISKKNILFYSCISVPNYIINSKQPLKSTTSTMNKLTNFTAMIFPVIISLKSPYILIIPPKKYQLKN